jgi:pimeloyl-ACP methyl ester carboxylesterase
MTTTTATTHLLSTPDGRTLGVDVRGPDDGPVVLLAHAAPGSRRTDPDPAATAAAGIRLLTVDRPGYGASTLGAAPVTVATAADDAALALDRLGVTEAAAAGWSAGGRVAVALAARHPALVSRVAVLATPAPDEIVPWYGEDNRAMVEAQRPDVDGATAAWAPMFAAAGQDVAGAVAMVSGGADDDPVLARDGVRAGLEEMLAEAFAQGGLGIATDLVAYTLRDWGFDPRAVGVPVRAWYGDGDAIVPPAHGRWWVDQVADGSLTVVPGCGHLVAHARWAEVLEWLLP